MYSVLQYLIMGKLIDRKRVLKSYRLSSRTLFLLERLSDIHDSTHTQVIEEAIREKARKENVRIIEETRQ